MKITLTFDHGPTEVTPKVLDILESRCVPAIFFVLGKQLADPAMRLHAQRAVSEGHRIGNHTFSHATDFGLMDNEDVALAEIISTQSLIGDLAGPERLFRPTGSGGIIGPRLLNRAAANHLVNGNYTVVLWTTVPRDWEDVGGWADVALADCTTREWSVVVIHDVPTGAMDHLEYFIDRALAAGATFTTELPPEQVPIKRGVVVSDLAPIMKPQAA